MEETKRRKIITEEGAKTLGRFRDDVDEFHRGIRQDPQHHPARTLAADFRIHIDKHMNFTHLGDGVWKYDLLRRKEPRTFTWTDTDQMQADMLTTQEDTPGLRKVIAYFETLMRNGRALEPRHDAARDEAFRALADLEVAFSRVLEALLTKTRTRAREAERLIAKYAKTYNEGARWNGADMWHTFATTTSTVDCRHRSLGPHGELPTWQGPDQRRRDSSCCDEEHSTFPF